MCVEALESNAIYEQPPIPILVAYVFAAKDERERIEPAVFMMQPANMAGPSLLDRERSPLLDERSEAIR